MQVIELQDYKDKPHLHQCNTNNLAFKLFSYSLQGLQEHISKLICEHS